MSKNLNLRSNRRKPISRRNSSLGPFLQYFLRRWASTSCRWYAVAGGDDKRWSYSSHSLCLSFEIESRGSMAINEDGVQGPRAAGSRLSVLSFSFNTSGVWKPLVLYTYRDCHYPFTSSVWVFLFFLFVYLEDTFLSARRDCTDNSYT